VRPFKAITIACFAALLAAAAVAVVPGAVPNLATGVRERPDSPALVTACWLAATTASIAGKRVLADGALTWRGAAAAHVVGTVSNRIIPAGAGAGGTYLVALRRGGMSLTAAAAMVALWAIASGVAHGSGALVGVLWHYSGLVGIAGLAAVVAVVGWRVRVYRATSRRGANTSSVPASVLAHRSSSPDTTALQDGPSTAVEPRRLSTVAEPASDSHQRRSALRNLITDAVAVIRSNPRRAVAALVAQACAMSCLAIGFAIAVSSFGVPVSPTTAMAAYVVGTALSSTVPTPAGIGSADAALVGALMMVGSPMNAAIPAVLVFRAVILLAPIAVALVMAIGWTSRLWPHRESAPATS
jgi:uncharacterized membrane protein YbhN (UPF0104 family)